LPFQLDGKVPTVTLSNTSRSQVSNIERACSSRRRRLSRPFWVEEPSPCAVWQFKKRVETYPITNGSFLTKQLSILDLLPVTGIPDNVIQSARQQL
jgi:hypothetical protein